MRACDIATTKALNAIGCEQSKSTETTRMWSKWLLNYLATHPDAKIRYWQSNMILLIHSDASCLVEGISTSGRIRTTTSPKKSTEPSTSAHPFSPSSRYQSQRQNSGERFIMQKRERYYASPWKKWVGNKAQPRSLSTITRRAEFATAQSNDNDRDQWTANIFG